MVRYFYQLISLGLIVSLITGCNPEGDTSPGIVPKPRSQKQLEGAFVLNGESRIVAASPDLNRSAIYLRDFIEEKYGLKIEVVDNAPQRNIILLTYTDAVENKEGYLLKVGPDGAEIGGSTEAGVFYGIQTFLQLCPPSAGTYPELTVHATEIEDYPMFQWRGQHLDVGRHFFSVDFIKNLLDVMAMHRMNVFHWHLTEDQGWRVEIKKYPKLTEISAWRDSTLIGSPQAYPPKYKRERYGGYYTQDEIREIVRYAAERHITVVPEIELPGHTMAVLAAYPELSCTGGPFQVGTSWGMWREVPVFCAGKEATFEFLENVFDEVLELFPGEYIHIGGDEASKIFWEKCEDCQRRIKEEGLKDEDELQSYFVKRIENYLHEKGRKLIGWDEILEGGLPERATVMSWRGMEGGARAVREGYNAVMTPWNPTYFYVYQGKYEEPVAANDYNSLDAVYDFYPIPEHLNEEEARLILGGQGCAWSEYMVSEDIAEYMIFPRMCAISEVLWTERSRKDWDDFLVRMDDHYLRLDYHGINYRVDYPANYGFINSTVEDRVEVELDNVVHTSEIRYTTDGSDPDVNSTLYSGPLTLDLTGGPVTLKSRTFMPGGRKSAVHSGEFIRIEWEEPVSTELLQPGLNYSYYERELLSTADISGTPDRKGAIDLVELPADHRDNFFAVVYEGYINVPVRAVYDFDLSTSRGKGVLYIGDFNVVDNTAQDPHYHQNTGKAALEEGYHPFKLVFLVQASSRAMIKLGCRYNGQTMEEVPASWFFHQ